jgi:hypothetical protein
MLIKHSKQIEYKLLQYQLTKMLLNERLISMEFLTDDKKLFLKINKKKTTTQTFFGFGRLEIKYARSPAEHRGCTAGEL